MKNEQLKIIVESLIDITEKAGEKQLNCIIQVYKL